MHARFLIFLNQRLQHRQNIFLTPEWENSFVSNWHNRNGSRQCNKTQAGLVKIKNAVTWQVKEHKLAAMGCPCTMEILCHFLVLSQKRFKSFSQGKTGAGKRNFGHRTCCYCLPGGKVGQEAKFSRVVPLPCDKASQWSALLISVQIQSRKVPVSLGSLWSWLDSVWSCRTGTLGGTKGQPRKVI